MRTNGMTWYMVVMSLLVALLLKSLPLPQTFQSFWPDWVLLILIYWNLNVPASVGLGIAWMAGLLVDASQFALLGEHALQYVLVMLLVGYFRNRMSHFSWIQQAILLFFMLLVSVIIEAIIATVLGRHLLFVALLPVPVIGALIWPVFQYFMCRLLQPRQVI